MSSCPPSASTPSTQALCQGAIKSANACPQQMTLPRSATVVDCDPPCQPKAAFPPPLSRMRQCQVMTGMGQEEPLPARRLSDREGSQWELAPLEARGVFNG